MKNRVEIREDVVIIILESRKHGTLEAMIDIDDLPAVQSWPGTWYVYLGAKTFFVRGGKQSKTGRSIHLPLYRHVLKLPKSLSVVYLDGNGLNNRRNNLQVVQLASLQGRFPKGKRS